MDDVNLRLEFHRAFDAVARPAPWLSDHVRQGLRRRSSQARALPRRGPRFVRPISLAGIRIAAIVLVLTLALAAAGILLAINNRLHPIPTHTEPGRVSRMCAQGGVYTVNKQSATLHNVSPPPSLNGEVKGSSSICDLDGAHAWVAVSIGAAPYQPDHFVVVSTGDSGQTWQKSAPIPVGTLLSWRNNFTVTLDFLDSLHGWLLLDVEVAQTSGTPTRAQASEPPAAKYSRTLFATSDGGITWRLVTRSSDVLDRGLGQTAVGCSEAGITFTSITTGWIAWDCNSSFGPSPTGGPAIVSTSDGGRTWKQVTLPSHPAGAGWICSSTTPIFTGQHGVLELSCGGSGPGWDAVYSSADGGLTWTANQLPFYVSPEFVDGDTGFFFHPESQNNGTDLYRTTNSGRTWTMVKKGLFPRRNVVDYQFIDANSGFADIDDSPAPWWTFDGGKTWSLPAPFRSIGDTVCPLPGDATGGGINPVKWVSATTGWASGMLRTTDAGAHWSKVGPALPKNASSGYAEFFLDGNRAWVARAAGSSQSCADHVVIFATGDGGQSWQQSATVSVQAVDPQTALSGNWSLGLGFSDSQNGWMSVLPARQCSPTGGCSSPRAPSVYRTSNGGRTWTASTTPIATDAGCGPASTSCPITNGAPNFFDATHRWLYDSINARLFTTSDGGRTWKRVSLPRLTYFTCQGKFGPTPDCSNQSVVAVSLISTREGFALVATVNSTFTRWAISVERTDDGGKTWVAIGSNLPPLTSYPDPSNYPNPSLPSLNFLNGEVGFWWLGDSQLFTTTNGGRTWKEIRMRVVSA